MGHKIDIVRATLSAVAMHTNIFAIEASCHIFWDILDHAASGAMVELLLPGIASEFIMLNQCCLINP